MQADKEREEENEEEEEEEEGAVAAAAGWDLLEKRPNILCSLEAAWVWNQCMPNVSVFSMRLTVKTVATQGADVEPRRGDKMLPCNLPAQASSSEP